MHLRKLQKGQSNDLSARGIQARIGFHQDSNNLASGGVIEDRCFQWSQFTVRVPSKAVVNIRTGNLNQDLDDLRILGCAGTRQSEACQTVKANQVNIRQNEC